MPYAFVNALLRAAMGEGGEGGEGPPSYVEAVRDALKVGGCNASRSALVGACVGSAAVSCGSTEESNTVMAGGIPLGWVERTWNGGRVLELAGELGRVRAEIQAQSGERSAARL